MGISTVRQSDRQPRRDWSDEQWLSHARVEYHSPWNDKETKEYWYDKIQEYTK